METAIQFGRIVIGGAAFALGAALIALNWVVVGRYVYGRLAHAPIKHKSLVPPAGGVLLIAGSYVSDLPWLSFVGWWVLLIDPALYSFLLLPLQLMRKRKHAARQ